MGIAEAIERVPSRQVSLIGVSEARSAEDFADVADLVREFVGWQHVRHGDHQERLEAYFDPANFESDLANMPATFARPNGVMLLAKVDGIPAGCIGLKPIGDNCCEMKRLYLKDDFRGLGIGRLLTSRLIAEAERIGYDCMRLETGPLQVEAQGLYAAFGFHRIGPYRDLPDCLRDWLVCMERPLGQTRVRRALHFSPTLAA